MAFLSGIFDVALKIIGFVKDKAKFTDVAMWALTSLPAAIMDAINFGKLDTAEKLDAEAGSSGLSRGRERGSRPRDSAEGLDGLAAGHPKLEQDTSTGCNRIGCEYEGPASGDVCAGLVRAAEVELAGPGVRLWIDGGDSNWAFSLYILGC